MLSRSSPDTSPLIERPEGLYSPDGDFFVDPRRPVNKAIITHAHMDHVAPGCVSYLASPNTQKLLRHRLSNRGNFQELPFGQNLTIGTAKVSLHPAGHILGSAQVRVENHAGVAVTTGDYKLEPDCSCENWEPVPCQTFYTESTFGLPVYQWPPVKKVLAGFLQWWRQNAEEGMISVIMAYSLGKSQRLLANLASQALPGPIYLHGSIPPLNTIYREAGIDLAPASEVPDKPAPQSLVIGPSSIQGSPWLRRFQPCSIASASGWMLIRGRKRGFQLDRGFPLSDHADWPGLLAAIEATGAQNIGVMHGFTDTLARFLRENGKNAFVLQHHAPRNEEETG